MQFKTKTRCITYIDMTPCKYLFFDVANTLLHKPQLITRMCETLEQFAITIDPALVKERHKLVSEIIPFPAKTSREFYRTFNAEVLLALGIIPTDELLDGIFQNCTYLEWARFEDAGILDNSPVPLGIISNWDRTISDKLSSFFDVTFCSVTASAEKGCAKPDPALYQHVLDSLDCQPEEIIYVGDSIKLDIIPATALGINAILIDRDNMYPWFNGTRITSLHQLTHYFPEITPINRNGGP